MNRAEYLQSSGWPHNSNNELLSTPLSSSGATGGSSYVYDANGNTIQKNDNGQIQNYVYDVDNRLIEVKDASNNTIAKYTYDPFGRRVKKELGSASPANAGGIVYYLYSDEGLIGEYDAAGNEIKTYGYKPNSTWSTDPLFMRESGNIYFYHNDHLGTPQKLTNISGAVVWSATYDAFGKAAIDASSTVTSNLRFPGQYFDAETGLHYNWNRYYDSNTGRYVTEDPIGFDGGLNFYTYVRGNPINWIDTIGTKVQCDFVVANIEVSYLYFACQVGTGVIKCEDECGNQECKSFTTVCCGPSVGIQSLPMLTGTASGEIGTWGGSNLKDFGGYSAQLGGSLAAKTGWSGAVSVGFNSGGITGCGVMGGPAVGLAAGGSLMGCRTELEDDVPCNLPIKRIIK